MLEPADAAIHHRPDPGPSMRAVSGFVTLTTPFPCTLIAADGHGVTGFVRALATDRLQAWLTAPAPVRLAGACRLSLVLASGRHYDFEGQLDAGSTDELAPIIRVDAAASRSQLTDLLHLVRKEQHIHICATVDVEASDRYTGFRDLVLVPQALPELGWQDLNTQTTFLGRRFDYPILITGMTGGIERAAEINRRLAMAAAYFGIPMGVGSQRLALENPQHSDIFAVKRTNPKVFLIGNLGFAQLRGRPRRTAVDDCKRAVSMIEADALAIHINVLQEVVQVEGDRDFRGAFDMLSGLVHELGVPLLVKEVGSGVDAATAVRLLECGVHAIDIGGKGGTSWSFIEGARASSPSTQRVAQSFRDWGIPTAIALRNVRAAVKTQVDLVATGGIRDGLTIAKAMALGADLVGVGLPLFRAALESESGPLEVLDELVQGLKTAMIVSGCQDLAGLATRLRILPNFLQQAEAYTL